MSQDKTTIKSFTDLNCWKESHKLALEVYKLSKLFPDDEQFGLTSQMRRAAVSVTSNIAEGFGRFTKADRSHFYIMALGSIREIQSQLIIARDLSYLSEVKFNDVAEQTRTTQRLISGLIKSTKIMEQIS